jgi:hypothetical protein
MWRNLAIAVTAAVSLGVAAMPTVVAAQQHSRGGGGGGGGGHSFSSGGGFSGGLRGGSFSRGAPGGAFANRGVSSQTFVNRGAGSQGFVERGMTSRNRITGPLEGRTVSGNRQWAMIDGRRHHGRHIHAFIPGIGLAWYWYYDDCYVLTDDYGWVNICGDYGYDF